MPSSNVARRAPCAFARPVKCPSVVCPAKCTHAGNLDESFASDTNSTLNVPLVFSSSSNSLACLTVNPKAGTRAAIRTKPRLRYGACQEG